GLKPAGGEYDVSEVFGEVRVPIVSDLPFAYYLGVEAGARYSDYSTAGGVNSFKYGGEWAPIRDLRFRGLIQKAVRAPNVIELYRGGDNTAPQARDFCDVAANPTPAEKAFCIELGVPADAIDTFQQESTQIRAIVGGNPNLQEETSDTWTVGFVYQPSFVPNLSLTVDYYDIEIEDAIAIFGGGLSPTITACRQNLSLSNPFCVPLTTRGDDGQLRDVPLLNQNIAVMKTSGIDFRVDYRFDLSNWGGLTWSLAGVHVKENSFQGSPVIAATDCAGYVGGGSCTNADPEWRAVQRITWDYGDWSVSLRHRYIGEVKNGRIAGALSTNSPIPNVPVLELSAVSYFDLSANWNLTDDYSIYAVIDNVFDKSPPIIGNTDGRGFVNTDSQTYDVIGRYMSIGARVRF
ncbi:MAG TPA: TonB-dependent receptor, partial [Steroidobacteraceae bacterium]|nr:TonB-dependent receptor [Steroidobacteraceae bacterium]